MVSELEAERRRADQAEQFAATLSRIGAARSLEAALAVLARDAIAMLRGEQGAVRAYGLENGRGSLAFWASADGTLEPAEHPETLPGTVAGELRVGGPARVIKDLWELDASFPPEERAARRRGMRSSVAVPICVRERRIGSLHVDHHELGFFNEADLAAAEALAAMAGAAIERAQLEEQVRGLIREQAGREEAEEVQRHLVLLGEVSNALAGSLDFETTLQTALRLVVPHLADQCAVDVLERDGSLRRLVTEAAAGPERELAAELARRYPPRPNARTGLDPVGRVVSAGRPELYEDVTDQMLAAFAQDAEHLALLQALRPRSAAVVPLVARGRSLGVVTFGMSSSGRHYRSRDLPLYEELGRRFALALDNARVYREAQDQAAVHVQLNAALREAGEARDRALHEAREALGLRDKFLSLASHELRTPITSLRGYAQLLQRQYRRGRVDPAQIERALSLIDHQSDKLARLAMQLLDTSRIETGTLVLERRPADIAGMVREVVESTRAVLAVNAPVLQVDYELTLEGPDSVPADVDQTRLEQVLVNLLDNAIKYSPNGGTIDVRTSVAAPPVSVQITVRDRGIGVPAAHRERIFERFYQVQKRDNPSGMGLGLYVSRQIVELHGGTLAVEFPIDGGSRFIVTLPLTPLRAAGAGRASRRTGPSTSSTA